ncbi:hypothetical protein SAMN04489751_1408 [Brevibacterium sandarakinum]|uniref:Uncharacterized protein n=2 Tax=Brevibacterium sandarakinum TaxID=629680 RepID=A0A1H1Q2B8_BRESA|nr:hypothetical protein SAMN04489751_1408 [Brevibacterium sandarakinum]
MGMTAIIAKLAVRAVRVLIVEVPGQWLTRVELEDQMLRRGWRRAWAPADADVLAVCGTPGPELTPLVDRLWEQMPGPRVRANMCSSSTVSSALNDAATLYVDTDQHAKDARERAQEPQIPHDDMDHSGHGSHDHSGMEDSGHDHMSHSGHDGMDHDNHTGMHHNGHGEIDHSGADHMNHSGNDSMDHDEVDHDSHADMHHNGDDHMDHSGHNGHGGMDHSGLEDSGHDHSGHGGMDHSGHGGMDMSPGGIPLAQGGPDRDGLEMDVLHLPLGPVLAYWPAGLVLDCTLQGDVVVDSEASIVDGRDHEHSLHVFAPDLRAALLCDNVMALLALAGADDLAARARQARDCLLRGDHTAALDRLERLIRTIRRSWLLRWSLQGVLVLEQVDLHRHSLPASCRGDAYDRMLRTLARIQAAVGGAGPMIDDDVSWQVLPNLVTGLELATLRLAVASVNLRLHPTTQGGKA